MQKDEIMELIEKNDLDTLAKMDMFKLMNLEYQNELLVEYLLKNGIHTNEMDDYVRYQIELAKLYLKYNIFKPLIKCSLKVLLNVYDQDNLIIDILLDKLDDKDKINLYNNLKFESYTEFHQQEMTIIDIYMRHGIILEPLFITNNQTKYKKNKLDDEDRNLINEFLDIYKLDHTKDVLDYIINEFSRLLKINHERAVIDIKKLIDYKKDNPKFHFIFSKNQKDESFSYIDQMLSLSKVDFLKFEHELSHLLYEGMEKDNEEVLLEYESIRKSIDNDQIIEKIKNYLIKFHQIYDKKKHEFSNEYLKHVIDKYGSIDKYIEIVAKDILNSKTKTIETWDSKTNYKLYYFIEDENILDIVKEFLIIEKEEYISNLLQDYFKEELMLENLLDALLLGKIFNENLDIEPLSGHDTLWFIKIPNLSFNECLADYDALLKSEKKNLMINDLENLVGKELIIFLDNYIKKNREGAYGTYGNR